MRFDRDQMRISHSDLSTTPGTPRRRDHIIMINAVNIEHTIMMTPTIFQVSSS